MESPKLYSFYAIFFGNESHSLLMTYTFINSGFMPSVKSEVILGVVKKAFCAYLTFVLELPLKINNRASNWIEHLKVL